MRANQPYKVFLSFIVLLTVCAFYPGWAAPQVTQDSTASGELNPDRPPTPSETVPGWKHTGGSDEPATVSGENAETHPATLMGEGLGETFLGGTVETEQVVERAVQTEPYLDSNDVESDGVLILTIPAAAIHTLGSAEPLSTDSYVWWNWSGSLSIPDGPDGSWVGINCFEVSVPAGAQVTKVEVHHEITHTYIGDLEVKVYNSSHTWMVRDNEGGSADNINETRTEYDLFDGDDPQQEWYYRVRDTAEQDTGTLDVMQLYVYYDVPKANLTPYEPLGWSDKILVSNGTGTHTDDSPLYETDTLYVDWAGTNNGNAPTGATFYSRLYVDGVLEQTWNTPPEQGDPGDWFKAEDYNIGSLSAGNHTIKIVLDYDDRIDESNEGDNEYERTITVEGASLGEIHGSKWNDLDGDGVWYGGEPGLSNWKIYLDENSNGQWDSGEPYDWTDSSGDYSFSDLEAGTYVVAEVLELDWVQTYPSGVRASSQEQIKFLISQITTTGSKVPIYVYGEVVPPEPGQIQPLTDESGPLINIDAFRSDSRFSWVDGSGYAVVILDTGIDLDHPYFGSDDDNDGVADRIVFHHDYAYNDNDATDNNGHGSNVSSIVASQDATHIGMAPAVDIIHLKVLDDNGNGNFDWVEQALQWLVNNAATYNIVSVNLSIGDGQNWNVAESHYGIGDELTALAAMGVIVVSASGNDFFVYNSQQGVAYPSADANSLSVGAVYDAATGPYSYGSGAIAFSSGADRITPFSQRHSELTTVMAPGAVITGANDSGGTVDMHGTSQASPHIAGIAVLAQQLAETTLGRRLTMAEFANLIDSTGVTINDGDDENDNVINTNLNFQRVDMLALAEAILVMGGVGTHTVTLDPGEVATNIDFGNREDCIPPSITSHPSPPSLTICQGESHEYCVTASGSEPLSYQWQKDGANIPGATSSCYTATQSGSYRCIVSNSCGSATSNSATLTVLILYADFTASPTSGCAALTVNFTDQSTGSPTSWSWSFGDRETSTQQNPSHTYTSAGIYTVTLTASNACGSDPETKTNYVTVTSSPVAGFTGSPTSGCAPLTVNFTDQSTGSPTSWSWSFGDGETSTQQNSSHTYSSLGTYTVTLTASNACGSDPETKTGYIVVAPSSIADITVTDSIPPVDDLQVPFGEVQDGNYSEATITVINDGSADLAIYDIASANPLAAPFSIESDTCSQGTLSPGASCTLTVRFAPTTTATFSNSFDIPSDDADEDPVTVSVSGTGTAPVPTPPEIVETNPHDGAGISDDIRVPSDTSFAVRIEDSDGIDLTDTESIKFIINDSVNPVYEGDLSDATVVRVVKLTSNPDTEVTKLWAVYDRSKDILGNYSYDTDINIKVDAKDRRDDWMTQASYDFNIESETEHDDIVPFLPDTGAVDPGNPALGGSYDTGIQVNSGDLEGAKIIFNSNEPVTPRFGPTNELPELDKADEEAVGVPINLQPPTVFTTPVKIFIPFPSETDVTSVCLYLFNGTDWVAACDADGNILPGGDGCVVTNSRVNNDPAADQPNVAIRMYHFTGILGAIAASDNIVDGEDDGGGSVTGGGGGGSSGGCFIATAAYGSPMEKHVNILKNFRDTYLLPCDLGRIFIRTYNQYSPPLAHFIAKHEALKAVVRVGLTPLVAISYSALHCGPVFTSTMLVGLFVLPMFLVLFYRRRMRSYRANN